MLGNTALVKSLPVFKNRIYKTSDSIVFCRTKDTNGFLSNMCGGFPIRLNKWIFLTSEHLFQSLKLTKYPELQYEITQIKSPMAVKHFVYQHKDKWIENWFDYNIYVMELSIYLKYKQNKNFQQLYFDLPNKPIVELSFKDQFWGAKYIENNNYLVGKNLTGVSLMLLKRGLKDEVRYEEYFKDMIEKFDLRINNWLIEI